MTPLVAVVAGLEGGGSLGSVTVWLRVGVAGAVGALVLVCGLAGVGVGDPAAGERERGGERGKGVPVAGGHRPAGWRWT